MHGVELVLVSLLVAVAVLGAASRAIGIPYPIVLVLGGLVMGFVPGIPEVELDPDLVLVIFLPPLLYSAAFFASLRDLRYDLRTISLLAVGLVIATACAVAVVAHALIDGLPWAAAFALGAIVAPTDPLAAIEIGRRLGLPRRLNTIIEGESLINDGTALVIYRVAVGAVAGTFSLADAGLEFVLGAAGGVAIGLAVGWVIAEIRKRLDDPPVEVTISILTGYAAYVPAERIGASGVLAAVTVGIYVGWRAPEISNPRQRVAGYSMWTILTFLLNALLFVLIGLQLPLILEGLRDEPMGELVGIAAAVAAVVIASRIVWVHVITMAIRTLDRRQSQRERRGTWQGRMVVGWAGLRGAVSLAAALALPADFPARDQLLFITFGVILATLVLQGLTLPAVIRWAGLHDDGAEAEEELLARRRAAEAALARIDELEAEQWPYQDTLERMRGLYRYRLRRLGARAGEQEDGDGTDYEHRSRKYQWVVRSVLDAQHDAVVLLRNTGEISNDVMHRIERELDLEDERLEI
ncbi:MAG TPA: Na+/H+ antiporter [Solirubrobacteraceae bacterium]|nr:Na+/H+ antiporter [Solirubrobacteraceae bacterium]